MRERIPAQDVRLSENQKKLHEHQEALGFLIGLLRGNRSSRDISRLLTETYAIEIDRQVFQQWSKKSKEQSGSASANANEMLIEWLTRTLCVDDSSEIFRRGLKRGNGLVARTGGTKKQARSYEAQNMSWMTQPAVCYAVRAVLNGGGTPFFVWSFLQKRGVAITRGAVQAGIMSDAFTRMVAQADQVLGQGEKEKIEREVHMLLEEHRASVRETVSTMADARWERARAETPIVGKPRFGPEPPATRHWWHSPRAKALAALLFKNGHSTGVVERVIERAYGIPTNKDKIDSQLRTGSVAEGETIYVVFGEAHIAELQRANMALLKEVESHYTLLLRDIRGVQEEIRMGVRGQVYTRSRKESPRQFVLAEQSNGDLSDTILQDEARMLKDAFMHAQPIPKETEEILNELVSVLTQNTSAMRIPIQYTYTTRAVPKEFGKGRPKPIEVLTCSVRLTDIPKNSDEYKKRIGLLRALSSILEVHQQKNLSRVSKRVHRAMHATRAREICLEYIHRVRTNGTWRDVRIPMVSFTRARS